MIDRDIMEELQSRWPNEWNATSSHRLRSGKDMQYAFAYFYYLIHARVDYNLTNVWRTELGIHSMSYIRTHSHSPKFDDRHEVVVDDLFRYGQGW